LPSFNGLIFLPIKPYPFLLKFENNEFPVTQSDCLHMQRVICSTSASLFLYEMLSVN